jgi:hypothetical protein
MDFFSDWEVEHLKPQPPCQRRRHCGELATGIYLSDKKHIIEAFRFALTKSKYVPDYWKDNPDFEKYHKGILNVEKLLEIPLSDYEAQI